ncbi:hypothetical protein SAMN05216567_10110 [Variovorax sp. OK605]|uniref:hypothetical protein n=1 Tax=Variovorax sp. OK605 TaxID=1855317 RepID=UPI0008E0E9A0|nr:hypothetical protein [Variovorax sp. OK605]SFO51186.1 hypothetical protein SAMN05216567_10110 [Variovorax sp. OK605]
MSAYELISGPEATAVVALHASPACTGHSRPFVRPLATSFRACELCTHSTATAGRLLCDSPAVRLSGHPEALEVARSASGSCGPNARHLDIPAWH